MFNQTEYNKKYYARTVGKKNSYKRWQKWEIEMIVDKPCCDTDLSDILQRSMKAIVVKRSQELKKIRRDCEEALREYNRNLLCSELPRYDDEYFMIPDEI